MKQKIISLIALLLITLPGISVAAGQNAAGAVYVMTNAPSPEGNEVVIFNRDAKGSLTMAGSFSTGGVGSGGDAVDPLESQGALTLSLDDRWLFAVNAGSNEISVFRVLPEGLELTDTVSSGGAFPISVSAYRDLVYVLNDDSDSITGFTLSDAGQLTPLESSTRDLGAGGFGQVGFDPHGRNLVITNRTSNQILVFSIGKDGRPGINPVISPSVGNVPFGFVFNHQGHLVVSEAGSGAVSSYDILPDLSLQVISGSVVNGQAGVCWIDINSQGYVFTSNTGSSSISAYKLKAGDGSLALLDAVAFVGDPGNLNTDMTIVNNRFLYVLNAGSGTVGMFRINSDGSLTNLGVAGDLPTPFAQGIAAR